jgi:hypothetical protein
MWTAREVTPQTNACTIRLRGKCREETLDQPLSDENTR